MKIKFYAPIFLFLVSCSTGVHNELVKDSRTLQKNIDTNNFNDKINVIEVTPRNKLKNRTIAPKEIKKIDFDINYNENFKIEKAEKGKYKENSNFDNKIHIFEAGFDSYNISLIREKHPNIKIEKEEEINSNYSENRLGFNVDSDHGYNVLNTIFDNNNFYNYTKNNDKLEKDITMYHNTVSLVDIFNSTGIINMSYGQSTSNLELGTLNKNSKYINKLEGISEEKLFTEASLLMPHRLGDFSNKLFNKQYLDNRQLKIRALGNANDFMNTGYFNNGTQTTYQAMSPEVQKIARNDVINVKNAVSDRFVDDNKYEAIIYHNSRYFTDVVDDYGNVDKLYEFSYDRGKSDSKAMLLRSFTVAENGVIYGDLKPFLTGSSFSAPKVTRLAYEIKEKFPFLSLNQVKQVILTTAKRDKTGYLSNYIGWGLVDYEKALKGPSMFNLGLIEEQSFYPSDYEKIYDKENNNWFFYTNIENGEYTFSNNIESGLRGNENNKEVEVFSVFGRDFFPYDVLIDPSYYGRQDLDKANYDGAHKYNYSIPKILESERNYYKKTNTGIKKDGAGTLNLNGIQYYSGISEVLNGTLNLNNHSNSLYKVYDKGILNFGENPERNVKEIVVKNKVFNDGIVNFKKNTILADYKGTEKSSTSFDSNVVVKTKNFITNGKISFNFDKNADISKLKEIVKAEKIDLNSSTLENVFLKLKVEDKGNYRTLDVYSSFEELPKLSSLTREELKDIPSYDVAKQNFFEEYNKDDYEHDYTAFLKILKKEDNANNDNYDNYEGNELTTTNSRAITRNLLSNYKSSSINRASEDLFNTNFVDDLNNNLLINENLDNNDLQLELSEIPTLNNSIKFNAFDFIEFKNKKTGYKSNSISSSLLYDIKVSENMSLGIKGTYINTKAVYDLENSSNKNKFNTNSYALGLNFKYNKDNIGIFSSISHMIQKTNAERYLNDTKSLSDYKTSITTLKFMPSYKFNISENFSLKPYIQYKLGIFRINQFTEKNNELQDYVRTIKDNTILKHTFVFGTEAKYIHNDLALRLNTFANVKVNPNTVLNVENIGINYKTSNELNKYDFNINLGLDYNINNKFNISLDTRYNTTKKLGVSLTLGKEF